MILKEMAIDGLKIQIHDSRKAMGKAACESAVAAIERVLSLREEANLILAAAPSQNEILEELSNSNLDFSRINAFHMDEYLGLSPHAPQLFSNFLKVHIWNKVKFKNVYCFDPTADADAECERYSNLLKRYPPDVSLIGIGENGHIAFNDPHTANFSDKALVKPVTLDERCRMQQVNDGCFDALENVPNLALTLTIPVLLSAGEVICTVPSASKAQAVENAVRGCIGEWCPASALRIHCRCSMFTDSESGSRLL